MKKVLVLMSTFNGIEFLEEQINSIFSQIGVEVDLLIRDDGSSDGSREYLWSYREKFNDVMRIIKGQNIGAKKSFLELICVAKDEYDFYAFADQDDIWDEDKLISAVRLLEKENMKMPLIYASPVREFKGGEVGKVYFNESNQFTFGNFLIKNYFPGCTMVFNGRLKQLVRSCDISQLPSYPLHDHWLNLICTGCGGKVIMDTEPHILYRIHDRNEVGIRKNIVTKIMENGLLTNENIRLRIAERFYQEYSGYVSLDAQETLKRVISYKKSMKNRFRLALDRRVKPIRYLEKIVIMMNVILGKF